MLSTIMDNPLCKQKFSELYILPETTKAAKFLSLYKRIEKFKYVIEESVSWWIAVFAAILN